MATPLAPLPSIPMGPNTSGTLSQSGFFGPYANLPNNPYLLEAAKAQQLYQGSNAMMSNALAQDQQNLKGLGLSGNLLEAAGGGANVDPTMAAYQRQLWSNYSTQSLQAMQDYANARESFLQNIGQNAAQMEQQGAPQNVVSSYLQSQEGAFGGYFAPQQNQGILGPLYPGATSSGPSPLFFESLRYSPQMLPDSTAIQMYGTAIRQAETALGAKASPEAKLQYAYHYLSQQYPQGLLSPYAATYLSYMAGAAGSNPFAPPAGSFQKPTSKPSPVESQNQKILAYLRQMSTVNPLSPWHALPFPAAP